MMMGRRRLSPLRPLLARCRRASGTSAPDAYNHAAVEAKWQQRWDDSGLHRASRREGREKKYVLDMFPYPSGEGLHVGHVLGYTATDVMARYWRMQGYDVLHPMGWDAFGLPAEQHALDTGTHPRDTTVKNIANFRRQLRRLGFSYDWGRELATTDVSYVRWTQWIFLRLLELGLAEQREVEVNWCPALGTVLANEEVIDGLSERGGHPVVKQPLRQWVLRITDYADKLLEGLDGASVVVGQRGEGVDGIEAGEAGEAGEEEKRGVSGGVGSGSGGEVALDWPAGTLAAQRQWIGRSEGAKIRFPLLLGGPGSAHIAATAAALPPLGSASALGVEVFTTRPDTLLGVTYVAVGANSAILREALEATASASSAAPCSREREAVEAFAERLRAEAAVAAPPGRADASGSGEDGSAAAAPVGMDTGLRVTHPLTGEALPVYVADYVLDGYGTGAVMGVPAHDDRDAAFAAAHGLPVRHVIEPLLPAAAAVEDQARQEQQQQQQLAAQGKDSGAFTGEGRVVNSGHDLDGLSTAEAKAAVVKLLEDGGKGERSVSYHLRDWVFSRQRYWGEPIPVVFPVEMEDGGFLSSDPRRGDPHTIRYDQPIAVPDAELPVTLPTNCDIQPGEDPDGPLARALNWRYFRGEDGSWFARETNTMPQWAGSCWYYLRFCDPTNVHVPWTPASDRAWMPVDLYLGGSEHAVLHLLYARFWHRVLFDIGAVSTKEPFQKLVHQGMILGSDHEKMSKSRGNVVNPDALVDEYGADVLRLFEMRLGPIEATKPWNPEQIQGVTRFSARVHAMTLQLASWERRRAAGASGPGGDEDKAAALSLRQLTHRTIRDVTTSIDDMKFNAAVAKLMVLSNAVQATVADLGNRDSAAGDAARGAAAKEALDSLLAMLSPFAPHMAEECSDIMAQARGLDTAGAVSAGGGGDSIGASTWGLVAQGPWPAFDEELAREELVGVGVQVNGKRRASVELPRDATDGDARQAALALAKVQKFVGDKDIKKFIYVPGKIINVIVAD